MSKQLKYRLRELRLFQNKTCLFMATKCQVTEATYRLWELYPIKDKRMVPSDHLRTLCKELGISMEEVFNEPVQA